MDQPKLISSYESPAEARLEMPDGLTIVVTRVPLESGASQLAMFINTEDMAQDHFDPEDGRSGAGAGIPEMEVILNDAVLYDCEPDTEGRDKAAEARESVLNAAVAVLDSEGGIASMGELAAAVKAAGSGDFTAHYPNITGEES